MRQIKVGFAGASGLLAGLLVYAAVAASPDSYTKVEAHSLVTSPQNSWARAILFADELVQGPAGRAQRLDRKNYLPMRLKVAGTVWVPEGLAPKFQALVVGNTYSFAGTVDQISRRYYIIVDACYSLQTAADMSQRWTDMLNPPTQTEAERQASLSEAAMQGMLIAAQNSLIRMAKANDVTVAQLIEAQTDGGQRIAEHIVAEALQGELRSQNKTAEELMIGSVLALLQKQAVLAESQQAAEENLARAETAAMVPEDVVADVAPVAQAAEPAAEPVEEPIAELVAPAPEAVEPEPVVAVVEPPAGEPAPDEPDAVAAVEVPEEEVMVDLPTTEAEPVASVVEPSKKSQKKKQKPRVKEAAAEEPAVVETTADAATDWPPDPAVEAEIAAAEEILPRPVPSYTGEAIAPPPSSMLVVPLTGQPEMVPMVSMQPTKAELARQKKQEALAERERVHAERKAAEEAKAAAAKQARDEVLAKKAAEREARLAAKRVAEAEAKVAAEARQEAQRLAAAEAKAEKEALLAERARQRAEEQRAREEAAAIKAAEWKAQQEAKQAAAEALRQQKEEAARVAQEQGQAEQAMLESEALAKRAEAAAMQRAETEKRLAEMAARKAAAEEAIRALEAEKEAALAQRQAELAAQADADRAALDAANEAIRARQAEDIAIAQEVTEYERQQAEEAAERVALEDAARQAAAAELARLEQEARDLEKQAAKTRQEIKRGTIESPSTVTQVAAETEQAEPALDVPPMRPDDELTDVEIRKQEAAARKAAWLAEREAKAQAKAAAKAQAKDRQAAAAEARREAAAELQQAITDGDVPEWMQPVQF